MLALPHETSADLYRDPGWRDRARRADPGALEPPVVEDRGAGDPGAPGRDRRPSRAAGRRPRYHALRPDARPCPDRRHGDPLPGGHGQRRRRRDRRPPGRQAHPPRPLRRRRPCQPALRRVLLDPPARPLGTRSQGALARGRSVAADRPSSPGLSLGRPGACPRGLLRRPRRIRSRPPSAPLPSSGSTTNPAGPTDSSCAAPGSSTCGSTASRSAGMARTSPASRPAPSSALAPDGRGAAGKDPRSANLTKAMYSCL